ncbi:tetratricopeptide repeat protein [Xylanibacter ruminicola]|uniref:Tetratricopeptide repeat-containing protein n=1 Tax=Xylanibacter ruminicola TaxID=839 RepID=A0A1M6U7F8_XYLRU|nr:tetratricopeptide repeat protein [Xylanibacter ruminicola]SHK65215.1 Tetratricopeptide repeat-containing protein [Xylanibacter ruminicola]
MKQILTVITLALLTVIPVRGEVLAKKKNVESAVVDSLQLLLQAGDSCMKEFNTFEALQYFQQAYQKADSRNVRIKLADCHYKRANYHQTAELLKNVPEDSLSHEAFRQLALSYHKQGDLDSYIYWGTQLVKRYPMDGEIVANLTLAYAQKNQPEIGLKYGLNYSLKDMNNIMVNRAIADAFFLKRDFTAASIWYQGLMEQGDSTFNTIYSAGMCYSQIQDLNRAYKYLQLALIKSGMQHFGCAYRLGIVCNDLHSYDEGLSYLDLALEIQKPDTAIMKAITLSQGEAYYLTKQYDKAVEAWKHHLEYNPGSVATYYNIANAYYYFLNDHQQSRAYLEKFLQVARKEEKPTAQLKDMMEKSEKLLRTSFGSKSKRK